MNTEDGLLRRFCGKQELRNGKDELSPLGFKPGFVLVVGFLELLCLVKGNV